MLPLSSRLYHAFSEPRKSGGKRDQGEGEWPKIAKDPVLAVPRARLVPSCFAAFIMFPAYLLKTFMEQAAFHVSGKDLVMELPGFFLIS